MFKKLTAILLMSIMVLSGTVMGFDNEVGTPRGEADCIYGVHKMKLQGSGDVYDSRDNLRYRNFSVFQCSYSRCGTWFVSENDPAAWGTIGDYFVNPDITFSFVANYKIVTDAYPLNQKYTPLDGFEFHLNRKADIE